MALLQEDLARAVEHFRAGRVAEAAALAPRHEIENALGTERAQKGDREGAERHYREALRLSPEFFKPHNNLGNVLRERGDLLAALEHYRAALRIEPSAHRVHGNLGNTLRELGLLADAIDAYRTALGLQPAAPVALRLAETLEAIGDVEGALAAYARAAELGDPSATGRREALHRAVERFGPFGRPVPRATDDASGRTVVGSPGEELAAILGPVPVASFAHDYFGKRALFVKGFASKYAGLFDQAAFLRAAEHPGSAPADHLRASFDKRVMVRAAPGAPEVGSVAFTIPPQAAALLHAAGATICITEVEQRVPRLAALVTAVKRQLGYPGKIAFNAYLSAPGTGFNWHFDARVASTLQIEGTKRWRFSSRPALAWPRDNGARRTDGSAQYGDAAAARADWERLAPLDEADVTTVILEPGDLLVLPAGVWHEACGGPEGSLALNLAIMPFSHGHLVDQILDGILTRDASWRSTAPLPPLAGAAPGTIDARDLEALRAELARAGQALVSLAADGSEIARTWASLVQSASPLRAAPHASSTAQATTQATPIREDERVRVRADRDVYVHAVDGGTRLCVQVGGRIGMELEGLAMRVVQRALAGEELVAGECRRLVAQGRSEIPWREVQAVLAQLVGDGVLERAGDGAGPAA